MYIRHFPLTETICLHVKPLPSYNTLYLARTRHFRVNWAMGSLVVAAILALVSICFLFRHVILNSTVIEGLMLYNALIIYRRFGKILSRIVGVIIDGISIGDSID
jgi:hypothetical protein